MRYNEVLILLWNMTLILWRVAICISVRYKVQCSRVSQWQHYAGSLFRQGISRQMDKTHSIFGSSRNNCLYFSLYSGHHGTTDFISVYIVSSCNWPFFSLYWGHHVTTDFISVYIVSSRNNRLHFGLYSGHHVTNYNSVYVRVIT